MRCYECLVPIRQDAVRCHECGRPQPVAAKRRRRSSGSMAAWAGFFGAIPFGLGLWWPFAIAFDRTHAAEVTNVFALLACILPLAPFALAAARVDWRERPRLLAAILPGLIVGAGSIVLVFLAFVVILPGAFLGLALGIVTVGPRWRRGDAAGLALALLGLSPTLLLIFVRALERGSLWPDGAEGTLIVALVGLAVLTTIMDKRSDRFVPTCPDAKGYELPSKIRA